MKSFQEVNKLTFKRTSKPWNTAVSLTLWFSCLLVPSLCVNILVSSAMVPGRADYSWESSYLYQLLGYASLASYGHRLLFNITSEGRFLTSSWGTLSPGIHLYKDPQISFRWHWNGRSQYDIDNFAFENGKHDKCSLVWKRGKLWAWVGEPRLWKNVLD